MHIIELPSTVTAKPVLNFDFSTIMLFRCTKRCYAETFREGKIHFSQPKIWIQDATKGRGDRLEGVFLSTQIDDDSEFINGLKNDNSLEYFDDNNFTYFRRKSIEDLYCLCFYGLNDNSFEKIIDDKGIAHFVSRINKEYFDDFSDSVTKEKYDETESYNRPAVIFISKPHKLFEKIKNFFINIGIEEKEIIISPVEYINKKGRRISLLSYPNDLLLKDIQYSSQSEVRIIINSTNATLLEYMNNHDNIIDIGSLEDIVEVYDYYFKDLIIERNNNSILFTLPKPKMTPFKDCDLRSLLGMLVQTVDDRLPFEFENEDDKESVIEELKNVIKNKFNVNVEYGGREIKISNASEEIFAYLDELAKPYENSTIRDGSQWSTKKQPSK